MAWKIEGQYFENCSCDVPCPCTVSLDLGADRDRCNAFLVFQVEAGDVDGVDVSGLTVAAMIDTPKVMSEGNWRLGMFVDEDATDADNNRKLLAAWDAMSLAICVPRLPQQIVSSLRLAPPPTPGTGEPTRS